MKKQNHWKAFDPAVLPAGKLTQDVRKSQAAQELAERIHARRYTLIIGIDPGAETGLAVWNKKTKKLEAVKTLKIHQAMEQILELEELHPNHAILVRVEDARLRQYLPKEKNLAEYRGKLMGAGSIKRDCTIWEEFLREIGVDFELLPPRAGMTKWTEEYFRKITGWTGLTSNHARDAAANVFGL